MTRMIRSMAELVAVMRARKDELNLPSEIIDELAGLPTRYTAKVLALRKSPGYISLEPLLETLGLGLHVVEDPEALARMRPRYSYRKRAPSIAASMPPRIVLSAEQKAVIALRERMKQLGMLAPRAARSKGGKVRAQRLGKRARKRIARLAAQARWQKTRILADATQPHQA